MDSYKTPPLEGHILIMDDEQMLLTIVTKMLSIIGLTSETAINSADAIEKYKKAKNNGTCFSAVILDLTVPGGATGYDTFLELKKLDPSVKAVVSSGYTTDDYLIHYKEYGFAGVIRKPYKIEDLKNVLSSVLLENT